MPSWESRSGCWLSCEKAETGKRASCEPDAGGSVPPLRREIIDRFDFKQSALERLAIGCRRGCATGDRLGPHEAQAVDKRPFCAVQKYAFGLLRQAPASRDTASLHSIEGKSNAAGIRFRVGKIEWKGLSIPAMFDPQGPRRLASRRTLLRDEILPCHSTDDPGPGPLVGAARPEGDAACEDPAGPRQDERLPRYRSFYSRNHRGDRSLPGEVLPEGRATLAQA